MPEKTTPCYTLLNDRAVGLVTGKDALSFLQRLISCDMEQDQKKTPLFGALLNAKGRWLYDFFICPWKNGFLIETEKKDLPNLIKQLLFYKLQANVTITAMPTIAVACFFPPHTQKIHPLFPESYPALTQLKEGIIFTDPRHTNLGIRTLLPLNVITEITQQITNLSKSETAYRQKRIKLGFPQGRNDMNYGKSLPIEYGFDEINALSYTKGCYIGQEVTNSAKHRMVIRKRLLPFTVKETPCPKSGTAVTYNGQKIGITRSSAFPYLLAHIKTAYLNKTLMAGEKRLIPVLPSWINLNPGIHDPS